MSKDFVLGLESGIYFGKNVAGFDANVATMDEKDVLGSGDPGWFFVIILMMAIGGLVLLNLSPSLDTILRGGFILTLCAFLETYFQRVGSGQ